MKRTDEEINTLIFKLKESKNELPETSFFGDNNWEAIDAQIWVLTNKKDDDAVESEFEDDHTKTMALLAVDWLNGIIEEDEML